MKTSEDAVQQLVTPRAQSAADALWEASRSATAVSPVRHQISDVDTAYAVQELVIAHRESGDNPRIGRKVGLTSPAVQMQLRVDQPDFGVLLDDMLLSESDTIPVDRLVAPRIEAEIAFGIAHDITDVDRDSVVAAIAWMAPALEIVDSRVEHWDITIVDTIADNASSAYFVVGETRLGLDALDPKDVAMTLQRDGVEVSTGTGRDCLGDPVAALVWVAETAARLGRPLRAGEIVMSGALGPMVPIRAGERYEAELTGLGSVSISTAEAQS